MKPQSLVGGQSKDAPAVESHLQGSHPRSPATLWAKGMSEERLESRGGDKQAWRPFSLGAKTPGFVIKRQTNSHSHWVSQTRWVAQTFPPYKQAHLKKAKKTRPWDRTQFLADPLGETAADSLSSAFLTSLRNKMSKFEHKPRTNTIGLVFHASFRVLTRGSFRKWTAVLEAVDRIFRAARELRRQAEKSSYQWPPFDKHWALYRSVTPH